MEASEGSTGEAIELLNKAIDLLIQEGQLAAIIEAAAESTDHTVWTFAASVRLTMDAKGEVLNVTVAPEMGATFWSDSDSDLDQHEVNTALGAYLSKEGTFNDPRGWDGVTYPVGWDSG